MQVINTNVSALFGAASLTKSNLGLQTAMQRLSSGLRINTAKDDPTGLVTATNYDAVIRGANMYIRNANDGISTAQINDGYMGQITENTQRLREIYVQTGAVTNNEATALISENTRLSGLTGADTAITVDSKGGTAGGNATAGFTTATTFANLAAFDTELTSITSQRAKYGADMAQLQSAMNALQIQSVNTSAAYSRVMDTDYAAETTNMTRNQILQQAGSAMLAQANQVPNMVLTLLK